MRTHIFYQLRDGSMIDVTFAPGEEMFKLHKEKVIVAKFIVTSKIIIPDVIEVMINLRDQEQCPACISKNSLFALAYVPYHGATGKETWNILCKKMRCNFKVELIGEEAFKKFEARKYDRNGNRI